MARAQMIVVHMAQQHRVDLPEPRVVRPAHGEPGVVQDARAVWVLEHQRAIKRAEFPIVASERGYLYHAGTAWWCHRRRTAGAHRGNRQDRCQFRHLRSSKPLVDKVVAYPQRRSARRYRDCLVVAQTWIRVASGPANKAPASIAWIGTVVVRPDATIVQRWFDLVGFRVGLDAAPRGGASGCGRANVVVAHTPVLAVLLLRATTT